MVKFTQPPAHRDCTGEQHRGGGGGEGREGKRGGEREIYLHGDFECSLLFVYRIQN